MGHVGEILGCIWNNRVFQRTSLAEAYYRSLLNSRDAHKEPGTYVDALLRCGLHTLRALSVPNGFDNPLT